MSFEERLKAWQNWFSGAATRDKVEKDPRASQLRQLAREFDARDNDNHSWFLESAIKEFEFANSRSEELDKKADSIITYLGATEGILTVTMVYVIGAGHGVFAIASIPSLLAFLTAIISAIVSRSPALHPVFPPTLEYLAKYPEGGRGKFAARISATAQIAGLSLKEKASRVRLAYWFLAGGLAWFVLIALVYYFTLVLR